MSALWFFAAWAALSLLAALFFVVGRSFGYRQGWEDARTAPHRDALRRLGCRSLARRPRSLRRRITDRVDVHPRMVQRAVSHGAARANAGVDGQAGRWRAQTALRLAAGAGVVSLVFFIPGTAIASSAALPGEPLWSVKRGLENLRVALASDPGDGAQMQVDLAARRLGELTDLLGTDVDAAVVGQVSGDLREHVSAAQLGFDEMDRSDARVVALQRRLRTVIDRHVDLLGTFLVLDCETAEAADPECAALDQTRIASQQLVGEEAAQEPVSEPTVAHTTASREGSGTPPAQEESSGAPGTVLDDEPSDASAGVPEPSPTTLPAEEVENVTPTVPADPVETPSETPSPTPTPSASEPAPTPSPDTSPSEPARPSPSDR